MNKELQIDDLTRGINDDEPMFNETEVQKQDTAHPGDKCWQDFMAYLEAPADVDGKADRLVCKLDRDLADSLDDCDIRGRCRSDLVTSSARSSRTTFSGWRNTAARRNHCSTTITPNPMRRINWTEAMLSRLAELYPVETTAHTACMLQVGVTAVKEKARELGLEKLAKSRWLECAGHISRHFDNRSYAEMAGDLGVSRTTVSRMARKLGLSRSKAQGYEISSRVRREMVRRERRRAIFGLDPLTRLKVISHRAKVRIRSRLKAKGYITGVHRNILYFTEATCRKARLEAKAARLGLAFQPFPGDNTPLSNAI